MCKHSKLIFAFLAALAAAFVPSAYAADGPAPAVTGYFPLLPMGATEDTAPQLLPIASNHPLDADHAGLTHAVIVIHDFTRDANGALSTIMSLAGPDNAATMIMAPQFLLDADIARFADRLPEGGKALARWPLDGWTMGGETIAAPPQKGISSFTALDILLLYLGEKKFFPAMQQISVVGHGAGGDFVQRYAAFGEAPALLEQQHINLRFVVGNASSYLYFTAPRPKGGNQGFTSPDVTQCANYNAYPYGLTNLNAYGKRVGPDAVRLRYVTRAVTYLIGGDVMKSDPMGDTGCAAMLQGPDRDLRAANYALYLNVIFGEAAGKLQKFVTVPKVGYDPVMLFGSPCGVASIFGDGMCESANFRNARNPQ